MKLEFFTERQGEEIERIIRLVVNEEFLKLSELYKKVTDRIQNAKYVGLKAVCEHFQVSRQTVNNWERGLYCKADISQFVQKQGRRKMYDLESIKVAFKRAEQWF